MFLLDILLPRSPPMSHLHLPCQYVRLRLSVLSWVANPSSVLCICRACLSLWMWYDRHVQGVETPYRSRRRAPHLIFSRNQVHLLFRALPKAHGEIRGLFLPSSLDARILAHPHASAILVGCSMGQRELMVGSAMVRGCCVPVTSH